MSPISVAQYLEPGKFEFDIVIMDEASQIKPQDAIGAIARGKTLVVVGDPKQLPPTSFFDRLTLEDEDEDEDKAVGLQQTESILDATIPLFRSRRLRWHYRSRHESLIAFSNHNFYDSNLVIFPSPHQDDDQLGIRHHHINKGRFVNGHNIEEAKLIAEAAAEQMIDRPSQSLGIIAMNAKQMAEIERQVDQLIKDKQGFSKAYSLNQASDEPLFIKNLENVQGDERDVIFMSMTYGPAVAGSGAMMQRFGPINSNVGWRRLNVLFTRAKMKMEVFTSMHSSHILTSETSSRGVKALKDFLQYCETGVIEHYTHTGKAPDSDFEISVIEALAEQGYACEPQLGVAGYYLDLAVRDPGQPGRFLMGIECDGATYHSAKSARDRDRLRQEILEELGWEIQRIWSTDWFKNPKGQLAPIFKRLEELKTEPPYELSSDTIGSENQLDERDAITSDDLDGTEIYFDSTAKDIEAILTDYDEKVIREKLPFTPISQRLLRPVMLQSLLEYEPCSIAEFHECIPSYLLEATADSERQYLSRVLELISEFVTDDSTSGY
jgi:very-short-patch-repair endonuclease